MEDKEGEVEIRKCTNINQMLHVPFHHENIANYLLKKSLRISSVRWKKEKKGKLPTVKISMNFLF